VSAPARVERDYDLARLTTIGTGGPARFFARPSALDELQRDLAWARDEGLAVRVVGLGSNLLVADAGFDGLVLRLGGELAAIERDGDDVACGGGASLAAIVRRASDAGLSGIEFGCAIPGTVGGAVRMNAGAYGGELKDVLRTAVVVSADGIREGGPPELDLSYRHSNVRPGEVVARARLALRPAPVDQIKATVRRMQAERSAAQPRKARTFGSVFKNPPGDMGAGRMLEACGMKGFQIGGARVSPVHANFIENVGDARSADVAGLIREGRRRARERFGVELEHEVELLGPISLDD
jgi:UDP-N-acetylmuramate dehydrogenase